MRRAKRRPRKRRKSDPPQEGIPGKARYWVYVWDGIDSGIRVGWGESRSRAIAWLREHAAGGWVADRKTCLRYTGRGRVA